MTELLNDIPGWFVTSIVVVLVQVVSYVAFRVGVLKDVKFNEANIKRNKECITDLYEKVDVVENDKIEKKDFNVWKQEIRDSMKELKDEFRDFRKEVRHDLTELRKK